MVVTSSDPDSATIAGGTLERLAERIASRHVQVAVIGCGYVGVPLAVAAAEAGFRVTGFDADRVRIAKLSLGHSVTDDVSDERLTLLRRLDQLSFTAEAELLATADIVVLAVPTPLREGVPDLGAVEAAATVVGAQLQPGSLVVLESTTYPGTTDEILLPILESASGLRAGIDFALGVRAGTDFSGRRS